MNQPVLPYAIIIVNALGDEVRHIACNSLLDLIRALIKTSSGWRKLVEWRYGFSP